ncbi:MAG: DMT family transporter [Acidobacteriota bacterium]
MQSGTSGRAEWALAAVTIIWGTSFTLVKQALDDVSVILFVALRFAVAGAVLLVLYRRPLLLDWRSGRQGVRGGLWCGLLLTAAYLLQTYGQRYTTPARSGFLTALNVVLVPILMALVYRIMPRWMEALGAAIALTGTALMTLATPGQAWGNWNLGDGLTIGCAVLFAFHIVIVGHYVKQQGVFAALAVTQVMTVAVLCGMAAGLGAEPLVFRPSMVVWTGVAVTGLLCTALAFSVMAWAQQHTTPSRVALIFALEPISAWLTSYWMLGERLGMTAAAGAVLILAGVGVVEWKPVAKPVQTADVG